MYSFQAKFIGLSLGLFLFPHIGISQANNDENLVYNQLWLDFQPHFIVNRKWEYYGDVGYRAILEGDVWQRAHIRPSIRYHTNQYMDLSGGLGMFYVFNADNLNQLEIRPWQGIKFYWPVFTTISFNHFIRLEERFLFLVGDWSHHPEFRMRYKFSGRLDFNLNEEGAFWFLPFSAELFIPIFEDDEDLFRNQSRLALGAGYHSSRSWRFTFNFYIQRSKQGGNDDFDVSDRVFQFKVQKYLNRNQNAD